eukprot:TRINITY_DN21764_c0_g1_i1.p1 TRINITY_DN21764_c0_g1~~TRINITY_DN21764_c0_g1_i1.p1  ORF type:complete len:295 (-),score=79.63 TRINITY_DN21764_c0_g1_i1:474-1358(-)
MQACHSVCRCCFPCLAEALQLHCQLLHHRARRMEATESTKVPGRRPSLCDDLRVNKQESLMPKAMAFPTRPMFCSLSAECWAKAEAIFHKMDTHGRNVVTPVEAAKFFKGSFAKISGEAMFNQIDLDRSGAITGEEFMGFWTHVQEVGYSEQEILQELEELASGGTWTDWNDGRAPDRCMQKRPFPSRPWLCRLSDKAWAKCRELFEKMDTDGQMLLTREKLEKFWTGSFSAMSVSAMFHNIDLQNHGNITPEAFMDFWKNVRYSGYSSQDIIDEIDGMLAGGAWVDWSDGRKT